MIERMVTDQNILQSHSLFHNILDSKKDINKFERLFQKTKEKI